jgi:hypothetical protein
LHLSIIRLENLILAQFSDRHMICLERTVESQRNEISRLDQVLENKSQQLLDSQRSNHQLRQWNGILRIILFKQPDCR